MAALLPLLLTVLLPLPCLRPSLPRPFTVARPSASACFSGSTPPLGRTLAISYPSQSKPLKIIIDKLYQYVIMTLLSRRDLSPTRRHRPPLIYLNATLTRGSISVASKELTGYLSPVYATLTKNRGRGCRLWLTWLPACKTGRAYLFKPGKLCGINESSPRTPGPSPLDRNAALHRA